MKEGGRKADKSRYSHREGEESWYMYMESYLMSIVAGSTIHSDANSARFRRIDSVGSSRPGDDDIRLTVICFAVPQSAQC